MGKVSPIQNDPIKTTDEKKEEVQQDDDHGEKEWGNPIEFLMTLLSFAVGLGNVWRYDELFLYLSRNFRTNAYFDSKNCKDFRTYVSKMAAVSRCFQSIISTFVIHYSVKCNI